MDTTRIVRFRNRLSRYGVRLLHNRILKIAEVEDRRPRSFSSKFATRPCWSGSHSSKPSIIKRVDLHCDGIGETAPPKVSNSFSKDWIVGVSFSITNCAYAWAMRSRLVRISWSRIERSIFSYCVEDECVYVQKCRMITLFWSFWRNLSSCVDITLFPVPGFPCSQRKAVSDVGVVFSHSRMWVCLETQSHVPSYLFPSAEMASYIATCSVSSILRHPMADWYCLAVSSSSESFSFWRLSCRHSHRFWLILTVSFRLMVFPVSSMSFPCFRKSSRMESNRRWNLPQDVRNKIRQPMQPSDSDQNKQLLMLLSPSHRFVAQRCMLPCGMSECRRRRLQEPFASPCRP